MAHPILDTDLTAVMGLDGLTEAEQAAFLTETGEVVLEGTLTKLMTDLSDEQVSALEHFVDSDPDINTLLQHLRDTYPRFEALLQETVADLKSDIVAVLGDGEVKQVSSETADKQ